MDARSWSRPVESLPNLLARLEPSHREALRWFERHAGETTGWSAINSSAPQLAISPKGIYKPENLPYVLSVRQTLKSSYNDRAPQYRSDGTWSYLYFQEGRVGDETSKSLFTNRGLFACMRDAVPIGVLRQTRDRTPVVYEVLGLALVSDFSDGYFHLEGFSPTGVSHLNDDSATKVESDSGATPAFDPQRIRDLRQRALAFVLQRPGQPKFRSQLLHAYSGACAITGADVPTALQAAHILPYLGADTDHPANGLLLRADLHALFDDGLLAVDSGKMEVVLAPTLSLSAYAMLSGAPLRLPLAVKDHPNIDALDSHRRFANAIWTQL